MYWNVSENHISLFLGHMYNMYWVLGNINCEKLVINLVAYKCSWNKTEKNLLLAN